MIFLLDHGTLYNYRITRCLWVVSLNIYFPDKYHERSKDCIVLNFRLLINQNAKKRHCRHSRFSQMQNVNLPFSMLHHAPGYGIIGARSSAQKPLR